MSAAKLLNVIDLDRPFVLLEKNGRVACFQGALHHLDKIDEIHGLARQSGRDVVFALPYCTIKERGYEARGNEPILALEAKTSLTVPVSEMEGALPEKVLGLEGEIQTSLSDQEYAELVRTFQKNEIEAGNASQTTLARCFTGKIASFDVQTALAIYRKVLGQQGRYMAVLYANIHPEDHAKDQFIVGATPERHLEISGNDVIMMPIAGTLRKEDRASFPSRLAAFLDDPKEINELFQIVDEEMKMMGVICPDGGEIAGPFLHETGAVVHTEYELVGRRSRDTMSALRRTLHAPTVVGSPMESAARIIKKYEPISRRYYAGEVGVYRCPRTDVPNGDLDTAILIRCAEIFGDGAFRVQAGGGLVRDSDPMNEAQESRAKAMGLLGVLTHTTRVTEEYLTPEILQKTHAQLMQRNEHLSSFWMNRQNPHAPEGPSLIGLRVTILNNEDDFAFMIGHILRLFKAEARVMDSLDFDPEKDGGDIIILGPGPGDPTDMKNPRMKRLQDIIRRLSEKKTPLLGVCLGHQALAVSRNVSVQRQPESSQGMQRDVKIGGQSMKLGFYNSFSPVMDAAAQVHKDLAFDVDDKGRIIAMRGQGIAGVQFHPESIMSADGAEFLRRVLIDLKEGA